MFKIWQLFTPSVSIKILIYAALNITADISSVSKFWVLGRTCSNTQTLNQALPSFHLSINSCNDKEVLILYKRQTFSTTAVVAEISLYDNDL